MNSDLQAIDDHELGKLRWRCRRGLLENDLILERFFRNHRGLITASVARDLLDLMEYDDRALLDLLLQRTTLPAEAVSSGKSRLLELLRKA